MTDRSNNQQSSYPRCWLWFLLTASFLLRIALALQGGQLFFGDETRYFRGPVLYHALLHGNWTWIRSILSKPEHAGFTYVSLLVTPLHHLLATLAGAGDWSNIDNMSTTLPLAAIALGIFSTLNLWLIHCLALRTGASPREADLGTLFAAASTSLFYYSRHLLPYDSALAAALAGFILGVSITTRRRQFLSGICAGLTYQIYNGYWFLVPLIGLVVLFNETSWPTRIRAGCWWGFGLLIATSFVMLPGALFTGKNYWTTITGFSRSVNQGVFAEGWSLPWAYFSASEGWAGFLVAGATLVLIVWDGFHRILPRRVWTWIAVGIGIYLLLVLTSVGLEKFVVYGRSVRPLVPFVCLASGYAAERLLATRSRWRIIAVGSVILAASFNFAPCFSLFFGDETKLKIWREIGIPKQSLSFSGAFYPEPVNVVTRPDLVIVNTESLHPLRDYVGYPAGKTLFAVPHPLTFTPYHYDGYTPRQRRLLREHPPFIKLIRLDDPAALPNNPPPEMLITGADWADAHNSAH